MLQYLIVVIYTYINLTAKYAQRFKMKLSLVVPCYNEEGNVEKFYEEVKKLSPARWRIMSLCL